MSDIPQDDSAVDVEVRPITQADSILVIEDEDLIRFSLKSRLEQEGYKVLEAATGEAGLQILSERFIDLVLLDYKLPDLDGLRVLERISGTCPGQVVIMMTAYSSIEGVVEAMKAGAYTYVKKPFDFSEMLEHVKRGLETTRLRREVERLRREAMVSDKAPAMIGKSPAIAQIDALIAKINQAGASTALILGESGTGKNLVAKRIHYSSARARGPFMTITCTDFSENLLESELFGHQKGSFTGATGTKAGLFELADGGTIFLDEIGDMPLSLQAKLLRFLEEKTFRRVGGTKEIHVDVRLIAATNQSLEEKMKEGSFREDLYYRLAVIPIEIPPLRDRPEDVIDLAHLFVVAFAKEFRKKVDGIEPEMEAALQAHDWPGNVRELRNVIERAMILTEGPRLGPDDFPRFLSPRGPQPSRNEAELVLGPQGLDFEAFEKSLIERALELSNGNQSAAARLLHMSRDQIRYRMEKFDIHA
ncbi:MAG: sigma-54-dependent Fis family transcriptional regulator [Planctomycetes bacterium]|nr:sigma-54-dependent Fis family transcriptional regulator [Planctomycetota bacterium]